MGKTLDGPIQALWDWSAEHHQAITEARAIYDRHKDAIAEDNRKIAYVRN